MTTQSLNPALNTGSAQQKVLYERWKESQVVPKMTYIAYNITAMFWNGLPNGWGKRWMRK